MPYQRASSRAAEATVREWRGTCSGKHYLLHSLFSELGLDTRILMCTHEFTEQNTSHFPEYLRHYISEGPIPDVHTFIRMKGDFGLMDVDATWPLRTRRLGMMVNKDFNLGTNMIVACSPIEIFEVPPDIDPQVFKEQLISSYCGTQSERRDLFIQKLSDWLLESTSEI
ncbi:MAG: hypothetical protein ACE5Q6_03100 [Dehalococcoidia bacterium]